MNDDFSYQEQEDADGLERAKDLEEHMKANIRRTLDDRYLIIKTIGEGRYAK